MKVRLGQASVFLAKIFQLSREISMSSNSIDKKLHTTCHGDISLHIRVFPHESHGNFTNFRLNWKNLQNLGFLARIIGVTYLVLLCLAPSPHPA